MNFELKDIKKNKHLMIWGNVLRSAAYLCITGSLMQTFLSILGFSLSQNYYYATITQLANVLTIILFSRFADKGNILKRCCVSVALTGALFLFYIPVCIEKNASWQAYVLLLGVGIAQQICLALTTVCEYKIPYFVLIPDEYGKVQSIMGVSSSIVIFLIGLLIERLNSILDYTEIMIFAFVIAGLFLLISGLTNVWMKSLIDMSGVQQEKRVEEKIPLIKVFLHPSFKNLFMANLLRGFSAGVINVFAVVALSIGFSEDVTVKMAVVLSVASFAGAGIFGVLSTKFSPRIPILTGSLLFFLFPLIYIKNDMTFLAVYALIIFGRQLVDYSVPSILIKVVPMEIAGPYHAWRMMLNNGGILLGTFLAAYLPIWVLIAVTIIAQLISAISYFTNKQLRENSPLYIKK